MTRHTCDICLEPIERNRTVIEVVTGPLRARLQTVDACEVCAEKFAAVLTPAPSPSQNPTQPEKVR